MRLHGLLGQKNKRTIASTIVQRRQSRRLPRPEVAELVAGYVAGVSVAKLAKHFRVNTTTVLSHVDRAGVPRRYPKIGDQVLVQVLEMYSSGESIAQIARSIKVHRDSVRRALKRVSGTMLDTYGKEQ